MHAVLKYPADILESFTSIVVRSHQYALAYDPIAFAYVLLFLILKPSLSSGSLANPYSAPSSPETSSTESRNTLSFVITPPELFTFVLLIAAFSISLKASL